MKRYYRYIICCLLAVFDSITLPAKDAYGFSEERPLVIVCDWDFSPFEFLNSSGEPDGYNKEVLDLILNRLGIPHQFVMQEWHVAMKMFENREADLIHALASNYHRSPYVMTQKYVNYYKVCAARRADAPPLFRLCSLSANTTLLTKKNDYAALRIGEMKDRCFKMEYRSAKDGLTDIRNGKFRYFVWGDIPLRRKVKELGLDSIVFDKTDIPAGELRIIGYNKALIDIIDDQYTRLEQAGELQVIYDKWFHPDLVHDDASPITLYILAGLLVIGSLVFLLNRLTTRRLKNVVQQSGELNSMMLQALQMGDYFVLEYDIQTGHIRNVYGRLLPPEGMSMYEFVHRLPEEEREGFQEQIDKMQRGLSTQWTMKGRWMAGTEETPQWRYLYGQAIVENNGRQPRYIVNTIKDITHEVEDEQRNREIGSHYQKIFETSLMAMSFYDAGGRLIDVNQKMRELCRFDVVGEQFFRESLITDNPLLKDDFWLDGREPFHVCQHMKFPEQGIDKYVELSIVPVIDDGNRLIYYIFTARDISAEREMYLQQQQHDRQLQQTNRTISRYEQHLHYLLKESNMYVWNYDFQKQLVVFSRTLSKAEFTETLEEYFQSLNESHRDEAQKNLTEVLMQGKPFYAIHHFDYTPVNETTCWYAVSGMPIRDEQGRLVEYFGIVRDVTNLMEAQQHLREETDRAENSGLLKSAFLANMTHEIRTPLNAIVGFSDLLQMVESPDDRQEFIRIIRTNCDMLLRLINDILEASSMGQSMTIEPADIDFAPVFDDICMTLEQRVQEAGLPFLKDNPYDTCPAVLDKGRIQQLLTNFVTNAVKYTKQGHIRVGYRREERHANPGLYFYCEDTGAGIPKDKQQAVFERFVKLNDYVQGTGLGLSICKAIVDRCQGDIGVCSEGEGHGCTFWFWVPQEV